MENVLELIRLVGNIAAKYLFSKEIIEEDSVFSGALGIVIVFSTLVVGIWILMTLFN